MTNHRGKFVVVGGGIAAVSCVQEMASECPNERIILVTASDIVKTVSNLRRVGQQMESFEVTQRPADSIFSKLPNVHVLRAHVTSLDSTKKILDTKEGFVIEFEYLCIATGGKPKIVSNSDFVVGIRDTETVAQFQNRMKSARRILVLGNGGIATELVYEVENVEVIWAVKHGSISAAFVDPGAATFFLPHLISKKRHDPINKRPKYTADTGSKDTQGSALGPDWALAFDLKGAAESSQSRTVHVEYGCEMKRILSPEELMVEPWKLPETFSALTDWPVFVELTNGRVFGCDLIVSATGVEPNTDIWVSGNEFSLGKDGGLAVNENFETNLMDIFAAGDVCSAVWDWAPHWIQMRLWTQARQMGAMAGRSMAAKCKGETISLDICFEIFTHVTEFFGFKVILLGRFNGQGLGPEHHTLIRCRKGVEYVKVLVDGGRVQGAVLIGDTDLEETMENLILNQTDVSAIQDDLLDPSVDIEDYFD